MRGKLFTRTPDGDRLRLRIGKADAAYIDDRTTRRVRWTRIITDVATGQRYKARGATCGLACRCDAIATPI